MSPPVHNYIAVEDIKRILDEVPLGGAATIDWAGDGLDLESWEASEVFLSPTSMGGVFKVVWVSDRGRRFELVEPEGRGVHGR